MELQLCFRIEWGYIAKELFSSSSYQLITASGYGKSACAVKRDCISAVFHSSFLIWSSEIMNN